MKKEPTLKSVKKMPSTSGKTRWRYRYTDVRGTVRSITGSSQSDVYKKALNIWNSIMLVGADVVEEDAQTRLKYLQALDAKAKDYGLDIGRVLDEHIAIVSKTTARITCDQALRLYLKERESGSGSAKVWQPRTMSPAKTRFRAYETWLEANGFSEKELHEVLEVPELYLEHVKTTVSEDGRDKVLRLFWGFYKWALKKGFIPYSPVHSIEILAGKKDKGQADVLTIVEIRALLRACIDDYDHNVVPWIIISLFAGVRPMEFGKKVKVKSKTRSVYLLWEDLLEYDGVIVSSLLAKTSEERSVTKYPVLEAWLDFLKNKRSELLIAETNRYRVRIEEIEAYNYADAEKKRLAAQRTHEKVMGDLERVIQPKFYKQKAAWVKRNSKVRDILFGRPDVLRHTFASYMLTKYDRSYVADQLGNTINTMESHYKDASVQRFKKTSQVYFELTPEIVSDNVKIKLI